MTENSDKLTSLEELEKMFKDRYTDKDVEYQNYLMNANMPPPVIPDWDEVNQKKFDHQSRRNNNQRFQRNDLRCNNLP